MTQVNFCKTFLIPLFRRTWQERKVAVTNDMIAFARLHSDIMADHIPLHEIQSIRSNFLESPNDSKSLRLLSRASNMMKSNLKEKSDFGQHDGEKFINAIKIETLLNGYNSGANIIISVLIQTAYHAPKHSTTIIKPFC